MEYLPDVAATHGFVVSVIEEDVSPGLSLPETWEAYLAQLSKKDRHELRRKFRRLEALDDWNWYYLESASDIEDRFDEFLRLKRMSAPEKEEYMTDERERFFRSKAAKMARLGVWESFFSWNLTAFQWQRLYVLIMDYLVCFIIAVRPGNVVL
ncbi:MAG: hypothetical protein CM1200mP35_09800 [Chloroflexota bacterium]|nr:MAG: hypothetical protein CM1200mP35_09800 [Chloroflexota bacterium]